MPQLTNPEDALRAFQRALDNKLIKTARGSTDPTLLVHLDRPNDVPRATYVRMEGARVAALVAFVVSEPIESGIHCFGIGYAVHPRYRGEGRAKSIVVAALAEFQEGLKRSGVSTFHVEAIVGASNVASQHVASNVISTHGEPGIDGPSGEKILAYVRKIAPP